MIFQLNVSLITTYLSVDFFAKYEEDYTDVGDTIILIAWEHFDTESPIISVRYDKTLRIDTIK